jgi:hypothetical protein
MLIPDISAAETVTKMGHALLGIEVTVKGAG